MTVVRGVLVVTPVGKDRPPRVQVRIGDQLFNPARGEVSQSVLGRLQEFNGKEVEFERVGGQPKKIREVGGNFVPPLAERVASNTGAQARVPRTSGPASRPDRRQDQVVSDAGQRAPDFHNPYNFVPAPPRNTNDPDLGDHRPVSQEGFDPDRYTGWIRVRMVAETPLLVPDTERVKEISNGHKTYPLRVGPDCKSLIPASSIRGMLRSAYEAITNSRFGRFSYLQHKSRLAFRMDAREGVRLVPARIEDGQIRLLTGTSSVGQDGRPGGPVYAAWLPRYDSEGQVAEWAICYPNRSLPRHGDEVECWVELFQHYRWDRQSKHHVHDFQYWSVRALVRCGEKLGDQPAPSQPEKKQDGRSWHEPLGKSLNRIRGWVCVTNANINRKHDERVFFVDASSGEVPGPFPVTDVHRSKWRELIEDYQSIHADDLRRRRERGNRYEEYLGREPGQTAWSRHVYTPEDRGLRDGTLCYVRLNGDRTDVEALFPVMISRKLYQVSPWDLLPESLWPAETIDQLSPADRVFGWVRGHADTSGGQASSNEPVAVRGLLRVGPVTCESSIAEAVETFPPPGVPLAILSTPKPQQGRFYVAKSPAGEAQKDGQTKAEAGYLPGKGLRGRKVYPHHRSLPARYWDDPMQDRTQQPDGNPAHYQEYRRPRKNTQEQRDDQNRSILGWVKPDAEFTFDLHIHNLSRVELGALLWLLTLPDGHFFRFGGGKPLGFGSARLSIDACDLRMGCNLRSRYAAWLDEVPSLAPRDEAIQAFKEALCRVYGSSTSGGFEDISFIKAFLVACRGFDNGLPIHYPRATDNGKPGPPSPDGESFHWFVENEREGRRYALRELWDNPELPTLPLQSGGGQPRGELVRERHTERRRP